MRFGRRGQASQCRQLRALLRASDGRSDDTCRALVAGLRIASDQDVLRLLNCFEDILIHQQWALAVAVVSRFESDASHGIWWSPVHDWLGNRPATWGGAVGDDLAPVLWRYRRRIACWSALSTPRRVLQVLRFSNDRVRMDAMREFALNPRCLSRTWAAVIGRWPPAACLRTPWQT